VKADIVRQGMALRSRTKKNSTNMTAGITGAAVTTATSRSYIFLYIVTRDVERDHSVASHVRVASISTV